MADRTGDHARPSCLVLHGLGGGPYELAPLIDALGVAGLRVAAPVLPGHDGPGPTMPGSTWREWSASAALAFDALAAEGGPVAVVGFSTGATLALELASRRPAAALVLLAPFLAIRHARLIPLRPSAYLGLIGRWMPDLPRRPPAVADRQIRRGLASASRFRTFSLAAGLSALELIERVKPLVPAIRAPTLILQGGRDSVVDPIGAAWLLGHLGSARKELIRFPGSDHLLALDSEGARVIEAALAFLLGPGDRGGEIGQVPPSGGAPGPCDAPELSV